MNFRISAVAVWRCPASSSSARKRSSSVASVARFFFARSSEAKRFFSFAFSASSSALVWLVIAPLPTYCVDSVPHYSVAPRSQ